MTNPTADCEPLRVRMDVRVYVLRVLYHALVSLVFLVSAVVAWPGNGSLGEIVLWYVLCAFNLALIAILVDQARLLLPRFIGEPIVIIDDAGVWDRRTTARAVQWVEIKSAHATIERNAYGVHVYVEVVILDKATRAAACRSFIKFMYWWNKRIIIDVRGLEKNENEILAAIDCYLTKKK